MTTPAMRAHIVGRTATRKLLANLPETFQAQISLKALRAGGGVLRNKIKRDHPWERARKAAAIETKRARRGSKRDAVVMVGWRKDATTRASRLIHLLEFGFKHRTGKPVAANPFVSRAAASEEGGIFTAAAVASTKEIKKITARLRQDYRKLSTRDKRALGRG